MVSLSQSEVENDLSLWATDQLNARGIPFEAPLQLQVIDGDAGFRCYYRLHLSTPLLAVHAPPATEKNSEFVAIADYLRGQGVHTPGVIAADFQRGYLLIEDFGDCLFSQVLDENRAGELYGEAMMTLLRMQQAQDFSIPSMDSTLAMPHYSEALLRDEMALLHEWFIPQLLGYTLSPEEQGMLDSLYGLLEESALQQPQVWVHRDYHSRNLIYREGQAPGVIDFQDAVKGPMTYDLVSLLRDCYVRWPSEKVQQWALAYGELAVDAGILDTIEREQYLQWFDWMGLQRHLKVLGIFARLWLRDGKSGYLKDLPLVIRYTLEVADQYPQLSEFSHWFKQTLLPLCQQQDWYTDYLAAGELQ